MAALSEHAKMRLRERFNCSEEDIKRIGSILSTPGTYRIISTENNQEIREIVYSRKKIQGIVKKNVVVTCIYDTFVPDADTVRQDDSKTKALHDANEKYLRVCNEFERYKKERQLFIERSIFYGIKKIMLWKREYRKMIGNGYIIAERKK